MLHIAIVTRGRKDLVNECVQRILANFYENIMIHISPYSLDDIDMALSSNRKINISKNFTQQRTMIGFLNHITKNYVKENDYYIGLSDDIMVYPDTFIMAIKCLSKSFPDGDGAVCLKTINMKAKWFSVVMVGNKFIDRFPDRQLICPRYYWFFQDAELSRYLIFTEKYTLCDNARIDHLHPASNQRNVDPTHILLRKHILDDERIFRKRCEDGIIWGL